MTWDSTVFPGQAAAHALALEAAPVPAAPPAAPGASSDVDAAVAAGETRITVMMGGATHPDMFGDLRADAEVGGTGEGPSASAGSRLDAAALLSKARAAAAAHVGIDAPPDAAAVSVAWDAIPQYTVGHAERTAATLAAVTEALGARAQVIGNCFHGVGLADSLARGCAAGRAAADALGGQS